MGKGQKKSSKVDNQKKKSIKKEQIRQNQALLPSSQDPKQRKQGNKETNLNYPLNIEELTIKIKQKIEEVTNIYQLLRQKGMDSDRSQNKNQEIRFLGEICQKAGQEQMISFIVDAQEQITEMQNEIFKNINILQKSYSDIKNILQETKSLNDIQINNVLEAVQKKISERKNKIQELEQIKQKGNAVTKNKTKVQ